MTFFLVNTLYSQIKGNPQMTGKLQQQDVLKPATKLSPALKTLHDDFAKNGNVVKKQVAGSNALDNLMQIKGDKILVDITVKGNLSTTTADLQKMGVTVKAVYGRVISAFVPISILPQLNGISTIRFASPSYRPAHQSLKSKPFSQGNDGSPSPGAPSNTPVISQGDTAQLSYLARNKSHVDGKGVTVGILSDSYDNLGTAQTGVMQGELPGKANPFGYKKDVAVLEELDGGGNDEGRAMMEIVHDVAPGAALAFHSAYFGMADFAQGIQDLTDIGCKVIADDIFYYAEPFFQDGIIAQSVDIAKKRGVTYFSSAGNQSIRSYESSYRPSDVAPFGPDAGTAHNFSAPGTRPVYAQPLYVPSGGSVIMSFQWDQSSFAASGVGAESDFDIYLTDIDGNLVAVGWSDNIASGEPVELLGFQNFTASPTFFLYILKYSGPDPTRLKYNLYGDALFYLTDPAIPGILAPTLVGHTKAEGAISTGAAFYLNTPPYGLDTAFVEYFSAKGGVANLFDINGNRTEPLIRKKPDLVAPDGGNTSFFDPFGGGDIAEDADSYPNFFGTSAAAPHAAGVAALMIQAQKLNTISPAQIKGVLTSTASDMDDIYTDGFDKGFDFNTGYGFINAQKAVAKVKFPNLYVKNLKLEPLCSNAPSSVRQWKVTNPNPFDVDVSWFLAGSSQSGTISVPPGYGTFTTNTINFHNFPIPNIATITWKDNFDFTRFDVAFSTSAQCGLDDIYVKSDKALSEKAPSEVAGEMSVNLAEVFPNPSTKTIRLYLTLASNQATNVDLYSIDGRKLVSKTVSQSKGIVEIDASNYAPGIYLLNVKQGSFNKTIKVVKQ